MKKISRFATLLVLFASFGVPSLASAQEGTNIACNPACGSGSICNGLNGTCIPLSSSSGAGGGVNLTIAQGYSTGIINLINGILVPVLMAIAFIVFLWGVFKYFILGATEEKSRTDGRQFVLWGIIGFVVILSIWGLVGIVSGTLGLQLGGAAPKTPTI